MNPKSQLRQQTEAELTAGHDQQATTQGETVREFTTPEELLRHDRAQTPVPESVAKRIGETVSREPGAAEKPWWKRLF